MNLDLFRLALANIAHAKKRSWLTMIGIFIGIAAVVSLVSLGQGLQDEIDATFEELGSDKLFIQSSANLFGTGGEAQDPLTAKDVRAIESVRGVDTVTAWLARSAQVEVGDGVDFIFVAGIPTDEGYDLTRQASTADLLDGRELRSGDQGRVLVGNAYTREAEYDEPLGPGDRIVVNGKQFTVSGTLESLGNAYDDHLVWMPLEDAQEILGVDEDERDSIIVQVSAEYDPVLVAEDVERALRSSRDLREGEEDFSVQTPEDLMASFGVILTIVNVVLIGIAGISLLVGGIGIMNTMYTAVLERTKEIGILKAIGATPRTIQAIFLTESGLLGLAGGAIGIAIGITIAKGVEYIGAVALHTNFISAHISPGLVLGALLFAGLVGMASGYLPARSASQQDPVESLRYE